MQLLTNISYRNYFSYASSQTIEESGTKGQELYIKSENDLLLSNTLHWNYFWHDLLLMTIEESDKKPLLLITLVESGNKWEELQTKSEYLPGGCSPLPTLFQTRRQLLSYALCPCGRRAEVLQNQSPPFPRRAYRSAAGLSSAAEVTWLGEWGWIDNHGTSGCRIGLVPPSRRNSRRGLFLLHIFL